MNHAEGALNGIAHGTPLACVRRSTWCAQPPGYGRPWGLEHGWSSSRSAGMCSADQAEGVTSRVDEDPEATVGRWLVLGAGGAEP
jgi:hypothetical protein